MATKIRLQRGGHKGYAFYSIVIADARAPRDGRFTEKIGTYNPNTNPALSKEGVYLMKHLRGGVKKGAFGEDAVQAKFDAWKQAKEKGFEAVREKDAKAKKDLAAKKLEAEKKVNEAIAAKVAEKKAAAAAARAEAAPAEEAAAEAPAQEA